jgi:uncharacterized protein HemY
MMRTLVLVVIAVVLFGALAGVFMGLPAWNYLRREKQTQEAIHEADALYREGQWSEAITAYDKIAGWYARHQVLKARAESALQKKEWDEADHAWDAVMLHEASAEWLRGLPPSPWACEFQESLRASRETTY